MKRVAGICRSSGRPENYTAYDAVCPKQISVSALPVTDSVTDCSAPENPSGSERRFYTAPIQTVQVHCPIPGSIAIIAALQAQVSAAEAIAPSGVAAHSRTAVISSGFPDVHRHPGQSAAHVEQMTEFGLKHIKS